MKLFTKFLYFLILLPALAKAQVITNPWVSFSGTADAYNIYRDPVTGNFYTTNQNTSTISKITASGTLTQSWVSLSSGSVPYGITGDASGNLYVTNYAANTISKITSSGTLTQTWATLASGANPIDITIDASGNLYTANFGNGTVSKITSSGTVTTAWATLASGADPYHIVIDASGNLYTGNRTKGTVSKITSSGTVTASWATITSETDIEGLAIDGNGNVYTANYNNKTVSKILPDGTTYSGYNSFSDNPLALVTDSRNNVYVYTSTGYIKKMTSTGGLINSFANISTSQIYSMAVDASNTVYALSYGAKKIVKVTTANTWLGTTSTDWGTASNWSFGTLPSSLDDAVITSASNQPTIGSSTTGQAFNLVIQNGGILSFASGGTFSGGNSVVVAPGGAFVGSYSNLTGAITLQQSIIGQRGWRVFANASTNPYTLSSVASKNGITISATPASGSGLTDIRTFDNSTGLWSNVTGTTVSANTPYALFIRGLASEVSGATYTGGPTAFTYSVSGPLNPSSTAVTPSSTSNFMIVGNPYAAPVNSKALTGQVTNTPYYTYQISQSGTLTGQRTKAGSWVAAGSNSNTTNTIPVLGVVAYQPASTSTFNITTADINTGGTLQTGLFGTSTDIKQLELVVNQNGDFQDKLFVRIDNTATNSAKDRVDLVKFYNDNTNFYTINKEESTRLAVDARKDLSTTTSIPLGISAVAGTYTINVAGNNLENVAVYLNDKLNNILTELKAGSSYSFDITADAASKGENRFELQFLNKATATLADNSGGFTAKVLGNVISNNQALRVQVQNATSNAVIQVKDLSGKTITTQNAVNGINTVSISKAALGMYIVQTTDGNNTVTEKVVKQ